jgi:hypothetical protein
MFILDNEQPAETTSFAQLLRTWWASLSARLRRNTRPASECDDEPNKEDHSRGLIL